MQNKKILLYVLVGVLLVIGTVVHAAPPVQYTPTILPITDNYYELGTSTKRWLNLFTQNIILSTTTAGCLQSSAGGIVYSTGSTCGSGSFPFTSTTNYNATANATTTPIWFQGSPDSLMASSTIRASTLTVDPSTTSGTTTFKQKSLVTAVGGKVVFGDDPGVTPTSGFNSAIFNKDGALNFIAVGSHNSSSGVTAGINGYSSRGTSAAPTASQADDAIFSFQAQGYGATAYSTDAAIKMFAAQNWSDSAQGTYITFENTSNNATTRTEKIRLDQTGFLGVGSTTPWGLLSVNPTALGSGVPEFVVGSSTATHLIVTGAGKVGVGTTNPLNPFHVNMTDGTGIAFMMTGLSKDTTTDTANGVVLGMAHNGSGNRQFGFYDSESGDGVRVLGNSLDGHNLYSGSRQALTLGTDSTGVSTNSTFAVTTSMTVGTSITQTSATATSTFNGGLYVAQTASSSAPYFYSKTAGYGGHQIWENEGGGTCTEVTMKPAAAGFRFTTVTCPSEI